MKIRQGKIRRIGSALSLVALMVLTCFIAVSCGNTTANTGSSDGAGSSREIIVATEDDYPPFDFLKDGKHVGYNQDLLDIISKNAPFKIKQEVLPWQGILAGIASGRYAATNAAASILEERAKSVDFTMPTTMLTTYYLKRKGDTSIKSIKDFAGKKIGVQQGGVTAALIDSTVEPELDKSGGKVGNVAQYGAFAEAYQDLTNKRIDLVLNNIVALSQLIKEKPDLYEIGEQVGPEIFAGWAVNKGNKEILDFFNTELAKLKQSGEMKKLQQKWLNVTFDDLPNEPKLPGGAPVPS